MHQVTIYIRRSELVLSSVECAEPRKQVLSEHTEAATVTVRTEAATVTVRTEAATVTVCLLDVRHTPYGLQDCQKV